MSYNLFLQKLSNDNIFRNSTINERYSKRAFASSENIYKNNNINTNKTISSKSNSKSISISEVIKKIESLKKKYNKLNYQKQIINKNTYKKILNLKKKYFNEHNKISNTESNINIINNKSIKKTIINTYKIETTDKISMINKSWNKKINNNLEEKNHKNINDKKTKLEKTNEINYMINSVSSKKMENNNNRINNLKLYTNYSEKNNKNIRDEFLSLDKKINLLLKDNDGFNESDNESLYNNKRFNSICPIKDRIFLLTDVKNKIKKINKDLYEENENEKTQNSIDSQITLGFKHIKPVIKKEKFYEEYFKDDEQKKENDSISKPILIRSLPRPKLNVPNYPSFFRK